MSKKNITKWNKMTLKNNYMFRLVMEKNNLCKPLIERILGIRIKSLSYIEPEKSFEADDLQLTFYFFQRIICSKHKVFSPSRRVFPTLW